MHPGFQVHGVLPGQVRRFAAVLGSALLLVAQIAVAAHSHSFATAYWVAVAADSAAAPCSLCAFAANNALVSPDTPSLQHASDHSAAVARPPRVAWSSPALSSPPGRGPPASA